MSYTNAQLLRRLVGDPGMPTHDVTSGDASATIFYLASPPLAQAGVIVTVDGAAKTETTHFTLDRATGRLVLGTAALSATDNVTVDYIAQAIPDEDIAEALRIHGLGSADTADEGPVVALLRAAAEVCDWRATFFASAADITTDGQSIARGALAKNWADRAAAIRTQIASERSGISTIATIRQDGYNATRQVNSDEVNSRGQNPRRRYYNVGGLDKVP